LRDRRNANFLLRNYNKKLLERLNYDRFIVRYKENSKSINILRYKQEDKKLIRLSFNKNNVRFSNAKEVLTSL
jgi:chorismate mutase